MKFSSRSFPKDVILQCVRWYCAYNLSFRDVEELMKERNIKVDHSTLQRWVVEYAPLLEKEFNRCWKIKVGSSWKMDETYIKVKGQWKYLYRAVDSTGETIDVMLTAKRDKKAALRFFKKAIQTNSTPEKVNIDKSGSNTAALNQLNIEGSNIKVTRARYANNIIEQDHRRVKSKMRQAKGLGEFHSAHAIIKGVELCHMLKKGQHIEGGGNKPPAELFYALAS